MKHFLLALALLGAMNTFAQTLEGDRLALVALYDATDGDNWTNNTGWLDPGSSPCGWYGVTCSDAADRVTEINLYDNGLLGYLPPEMGKLTALKSLKIHGFGYTESFKIMGRMPDAGWIWGSIPSELGDLVNLEYLELGACAFSGNIPASLGNLINLKVLDLHYESFDAGFDPRGQLNGTIPTELGNLTNLTRLDLSGQNLTGNLPGELGNLTSLQILQLSNNDFSGTIPSSIGQLPNLKFLDLRFYPFYEMSGINGAWRLFGKLRGPFPDFSDLDASAVLVFKYQSFNFDGAETNSAHFVNFLYSDQAKIKLNYSTPMNLWVDAGGTLANNTYRWYKNSVLVATIVGDNHYNPATFGTYRVEVTNSVATSLKLVSEDFMFSSLPVSLVSFEGKNRKNVNILTWKTTSEVNNSGFEIEKSPDAKTFEKIGFVDGNGDSRETETYSFTDANPFSTTYYRLKQIDFDGKFEYSRIISVKNEEEKMMVYPNPTNDEFYIEGLKNGETVVIRNLEGKVIRAELIFAGKPKKVNNLPTGLYTIQIGRETRKLLIQR